MDYVPLVDVSPKNGEAAVLFSALRCAGFDVTVECDVRGWMHWYKPFMSLMRPVTIWVNESELSDARGYIDAPVECAPADSTPAVGFWSVVRTSRRLVFAAFLPVMFLVGY